MDRLETAADELRADLDRVRNLLDLLKQLREFGAAPIPKDGDCKEVWPNAVGLWEESRNRRTDLPVASGSLMLYVVGRFEYFVRTITEIGAEELAEHCERFSDLPVRLQKELVKQTAEVLRHPAKYGYGLEEAEKFVLSLADGIRASGSIPDINSACLSVTESNMWPTTVAELLGRIGVENVWLEIGKQTQTKLHFQVQD